MGRLFVIGLVLLVFGATPGCGVSGLDAPACSRSFLTEYDRIMFLAGERTHRPAMEQALVLARRFRSRYAGVRCVAHRSDRNGIEPYLILITVDQEMTELERRLSRLLAALPPAVPPDTTAMARGGWR
jgi:hypothetical protein